MLDVEGFILVGGQSRRMGTDKARLVFSGQTAIERIATELGSAASQVSFVGSSYGSADPDLKIVPDVYEGWGAFGGIHAAISASRAEWALVVACDLPFVTRDLFARLSTIGHNSLYDAVVPIQPDGRPQPVCALYKREPSLRESERLIALGEHTPRALLANIRTRWVQSEELADLAGAEDFFFNVNTPSDYERAKEICQNRNR